MAEIKTGIFAKNVQKRLSRAQEKVLQKLGKADETKDEQFEQCVQNFKRQEFEGSRLQREMKAYIAAVKGMQQASRNLTESLHEVYEPDWHGNDDVMIIGKNCDALWEDFHQKLVDSTIDTLETYLTQFPDLKMRVAKRSRKLIDYDSARHHLETLQTSTMRNEKKIAKAEEDLKKAQKVFDDLNVGLQDELPTLWDSRVVFYVSTFQNVSSLEARFHREISFLCHKLYEVMNKLAEQHSDKMFTIQGAPSDSGPLRLARTPTPPDDESPDSSPAASPNHTLRPTSPGPPRPKSPSQLKMGPPKPPPPKVTPTKELQQEQIIDLFDGGFPEISVTSPQPNEKPGESLLDLDFDPFKPDANTPIGQTQSPISQVLLHTLLILLKIRDSDRSNKNFYMLSNAAFFASPQEKMPIPSVVIEPASSNEGDDDRDGDITSPIATSGNGVITECQTTKDISSGMPPVHVFKVETMHDFEAANPDELELKKGDIVLVVPTELAEDQDAGWLTGIRESDWLQYGTSAQKGLFPENFTQRLE
uniref:Amphiphysin-like n=1 Tax=Sinocyclocheilus grahami TaxID=75366 RepID=A0A672PYZ6_SINGR